MRQGLEGGLRLNPDGTFVLHFPTFSTGEESGELLDVVSVGCCRHCCFEPECTHERPLSINNCFVGFVVCHFPAQVMMVVPISTVCPCTKAGWLDDS